MNQNIIVALFDISSEAYQAFSELKAYTQTADTLIAQAVLVKKENGLIIPAESTDFTANTAEGAWTGGLIGSLVGVLGGPVGMLLGGAAGALIGSDAGTAATLGEGLLLENTARKLDDGSTAVVILAQESDEAVLDGFFNRFKTVILRQDAAVAQRDVLAAVEAQQEVARQAHEAWKQQRKAERKEKVEAFKADIKQKFDELAAKLK
ncbi:DUF1269 domain-containing protein [Eikenella sp. S3360]|uniref:DUF1269 domain-containing protein n=1 Tax=Eikenella glucosivorans TaxID=2766967 RepID=A0ABS0N7D5_9NEIS|nr:DUF1269 domain-containing protein [Eikenella glucosivorans]MBH5328219.1 DUF1269 domain-containing protein [Eikenella glucosivorans]